MEYVFVLVDKETGEIFVSKSKMAISESSGVNYHTLVHHIRNGGCNNDKIMFKKVKVLKSEQGSHSRGGDNIFKKRDL